MKTGTRIVSSLSVNGVSELVVQGIIDHSPFKKLLTRFPGRNRHVGRTDQAPSLRDLDHTSCPDFVRKVEGRVNQRSDERLWKNI